MADIKTEDMKEFLEANNYAVIVQRTKSGCDINIPKNKYSPESLNINKVSYKLSKRLDQTIVKYQIDDTDLLKIKMPSYTVRPFIYGDIYHLCYRNKYPYQLVIHKDTNGDSLHSNDHYLPSVLSKQTKEEDGKEYLLLGLLLDCIETGFLPEHDELAEVYGVSDGFDVIKNFYKDSLL
jgi:hypothetical protein